MDTFKVAILTILSAIIEYVMTACPEGIGIAFGDQLFPFGVCLSNGDGATMYRCNENADSVGFWRYGELNCTYVDPSYPEPQNHTLMFDSFRCDYIENCNYLHIHQWIFDDNEVETCESDEENTDFGGSNCDQTECGVPHVLGSAQMGVSSVIYVDYPEANHQSITHSINHCIQTTTYDSSISSFVGTGNYSLQNAFSCEIGYDGLAMRRAIYSDSNCENLVEVTSEIITQKGESMPNYEFLVNRKKWVCRRIHECTDPSIITPTVSPTAAPIMPTEQPSESPSLSPIPPTFQSTNQPATSPILITSNRTNDGNVIRKGLAILCGILMVCCNNILH